MKNTITKVYENRYFLLFILLFAYVQSIYTRIAIRREIDIYIFTPEAALATLCGACILFFIILFFIRHWQQSDSFSTKTMLKVFGLSLITYFLSMQIIGFVIAFTFDKIAQNFTQKAIVISIFSDFLDGIIYGSFFLAYYYYNNSKKNIQKLALYNQALADTKINQLKAQLNPHFLFNNLNALDELIDEDKNKASIFLHEFADIYRYVLQISDKDLVTIDEELAFANQYFKLIQYKYGNAYLLTIKKTNIHGFIAPLTLQLLLENAIQHNLGTTKEPIHIRITINHNINVLNTVNIKRNSKTTSGRALKNLQQQYVLLSDKMIEINQTEKEFSVEVPIIYKVNK